jgi:hypothetical protein
MDDAEAVPPSPATEMGDFLNNLDQGHRPADPAPGGEVSSNPIETPPAGETVEADAAERAALELHALDDAIDADPAFRPAPLLLRPLVWINAPLDFLPEGIRAGVGKVALITFFNALAILAYVLIFRRA